MKKQIEKDEKCEYDGVCRKPATTVVFNRCNNMLEALCDRHADIVSDYGGPEYRITCPNCGCYFGTN